jgi:hypothetical protein
MAMQCQPRKIRTQSLFFDPLEPDGSNYLEWNMDMRAYLRAEEIDATIAPTHEASIPTSYATHHAPTARFFTSTAIHPSRGSCRIMGGVGGTIQA